MAFHRISSTDVLQNLCFFSCISVACTGIYIIIYGLQTLLPIHEETDDSTFTSTLLDDFVFQHRAKPIYISLGYFTFFTPLIGCWAIILNRTRVLMIYIICLMLQIICMAMVTSNLLSIHILTQDEDRAFYDETEVLKIFYENFYTVDIARGTINEIQEEFKCCGLESYQDFVNKSRIPLSCCEENLDTCDEAIAFSKGCRQVILPTVLKEYGETDKLFFTIVIVQLVCLAFALIFMP